jgi:hypothetical protein
MQGATFGFIHDILVTENYYVVLENPISMNVGKLLTKYMLGRACLAECLEFQEQPTRIHLIPRPGCASLDGGHHHFQDNLLHSVCLQCVPHMGIWQNFVTARPT